MKSCPICHVKTIPYTWIFFGLSKYNNGSCFRCPHCGKSIRKSRWWIFDLLFFNDVTLIVLLLSFFGLTHQLIHNTLTAIMSIFLVLLIYCMLVEYFSPLREAEESYCRGELSRVGAIFSLVAIPTIIILTIYKLYSLYYSV